MTLPSAQTVPQLAAGFLRYMNVTDTIVDSIPEYIDRCLELAHPDQVVRTSIRDMILTQHHLVYEDDLTLIEWHKFLSTVSPRFI